MRTTRQPGDSTIGAPIRRMLLDSGAVDPLAELFLFLADRAQHVAEVIRPSLTAGQIVLCDRYSDSTVVYQGYARGLGTERLRGLNELATDGLKPDLTILLDIGHETAVQRDSDQDRLDREPTEFHEKVRQGFLDEASREPERWIVIDAHQPEEVVAETCLRAIRNRMDVQLA